MIARRKLGRATLGIALGRRNGTATFSKPRPWVRLVHTDEYGSLWAFWTRRGRVWVHVASTPTGDADV